MSFRELRYLRRPHISDKTYTIGSRHQADAFWTGHANSWKVSAGAGSSCVGAEPIWGSWRMMDIGA